jgi:glucuronate isomerase
MSRSQAIFEQLDQIVLIDSHSHINPYSAPAKDLGDLLGYHYYTELAHSAGMPREQIEEPGIAPREKVRRLFGSLHHIDNTIQWSWFLELSRELFGCDGDRIDQSNWESVYEMAESKMSAPGWEDEVLRVSRVEKVFLTNDFDDSLEGFDTYRYVPCLRTDDLVFHLGNPAVRARFSKCTGADPESISGLRQGIGHLFQHFVSHGAKACAISLPPWFAPESSTESNVAAALDIVCGKTQGSMEPAIRSVANWVFWTIAEHADHHRLPFDLMIGVNRKVYPTGVFQGQDLYDSRLSLLQYKELFNAFPKLMFPISVLASVTNQELVDYAWIFPNVITHGHWWYSNTPTYIRHDLRGRIEAIPRNKQIGYYSDAYKLEFILPKFRMYKRLLAETLDSEYCGYRGWSETRALELGRQILRGNVETIFQIA